MLKPAMQYEIEITEAFREIWFNDKYMYLYADNFNRDIIIERTTYNTHQFASIDSNGNLVGFIEYAIDRDAYMCHRFLAVNFSNNKYTIAKDIIQAVDDIFMKFNFNKLRFTVIIGNPIEKSYDTFVKEIGGRIVGVFKEDVKLSDGKLYDVKTYEIMRTEYVEHRYGKDGKGRERARYSGFFRV